MRYHITCDGVPVGSAEIEPLVGLAHAVLECLPAYAHVREHAVVILDRLREMRIWNPVDGDFAELFAREWTGGRLAICDDEDRELAVASVMLLDWAGAYRPGRPHVIVDARPDMARVEAFLRTTVGSGGGRSRPAA